MAISVPRYARVASCGRFWSFLDDAESRQHSNLTYTPVPRPGMGLALPLLLSTATAAPTTVDAFTSIESCTPFGVGIQPGDDYSYEGIGNEELAKYLSVSVKDGVLKIETTQLPFGNEPVNEIVVVVTAPSNATISSISAVSQGDLSMLEGFSSETLDVSMSGQGDFNADVGVSGKLTMNLSGQGGASVAGSIGTLDLVSSGQGDVDVFGVNGPASVDLSGQGDTFIGGTSNLTITGTANGMGDLKYEGGSCDVPSSFFGDTCVKSSNRSPPTVSLPSPRGTGIFGTGSNTCSGSSGR